jgi:hypothetical protein
MVPEKNGVCNNNNALFNIHMNEGAKIKGK